MLVTGSLDVFAVVRGVRCGPPDAHATASGLLPTAHGIAIADKPVEMRPTTMRRDGDSGADGVPVVSQFLLVPELHLLCAAVPWLSRIFLYR